MLQLKDKAQFTNQGGIYNPGDNITVGYNFTFNSSQHAKHGSYSIFLGNEDERNKQSFLIQFWMPGYGV